MNPENMAWPVSKNTAICVKTLDSSILFQNPLCQEICGSLNGQTCKKTCKNLLEQIPEFIPGMTLFKDQVIESRKVDILILKEESEILTLLYPLTENDETSKKQEAYLKSLGLTKSEVSIYLFALQGMTNATIANKLFISRSTLKTHLNNIYKKLPPTLRTAQIRRGKG